VRSLACVDVPALPLQLAVASAGWRGEPVAVVDRDAPHGSVLWVNERARSEGVLPGLRYSAALSLCTALRATEVAPSAVERGVARLTELLRRFSPSVEPSRDEPGVFWADVSGLELVQPSRIAWARSVRAAIAEAGFEGAVAVGFRRFSTYAVAKSLRGSRVLVFAHAPEEDALARRVPLRRLALPPPVRDELERLAVRTVGELLRLPSESVFLRFGPEMQRLHRLASGELQPELEPQAPAERPSARADLDSPANGAAQVLQVVEELVAPLLAGLARRGRGVKTLRVELALEDHSSVTLAVQPAEATLERAQLLRLLGLRLESVKLARGADAVGVELEPAPVGPEQLRLFALSPGRDPDAAARAFASLRAAYGEGTVVRARLRSAHLPEASFAWEELAHLEAPRPREVERPPLVRRILARPQRLPSRTRHEEDGWLLRGLAHGPVVQLHGPFLVSGGWWKAQVERDYSFAEMQSGEILWIYFDRPRRRWFLQGSVA
jgi:protein ImuB